MRHISVIVAVLVQEIGAREQRAAPARSVEGVRGNIHRHRIGYGMADQRMKEPMRAVTSLKDPTPLGV